MARPIELGLNPGRRRGRRVPRGYQEPKKPTKEQIKMFREAIRIYKEHPVS